MTSTSTEMALDRLMAQFDAVEAQIRQHTRGLSPEEVTHLAGQMMADKVGRDWRPTPIHPAD